MPQPAQLLLYNAIFLIVIGIFILLVYFMNEDQRSFEALDADLVD